MKNEFRYSAEIPFTGSVTIELVSNTELKEDSIFNTACEKASEWLASSVRDKNGILNDFEFHKRIVSGNIFYGCCNEFNYIDETEEE